MACGSDTAATVPSDSFYSLGDAIQQPEEGELNLYYVLLMFSFQYNPNS